MAFAIIAVALSACNPSPESDVDRYLRARARWERVNSGDYEMTLSINSQIAQQPLIITVRHGAVVAARGTLDGKPVEGSALTTVPTVDAIFDQIRDALRGKDAAVTLEFDRLLGYPKSAFLDFSARWADDEVGYLIHALKLSEALTFNASAHP